MIGRNRQNGDWQGLLELLEGDTPYEERLDLVLERVTELTGLEAAYLYAPDETGAHYHLERARSSGGQAGTGAAEGGAEAIETTPPLEIPMSAENAEPRAVATPVGRLWSVPLDGAGLLQAGPLRGDRPPARARAALEAIRFPLGLVVGRSRTETVLRTRLAALDARVQAVQKLTGSALDLHRYVGLLLELAVRATRSEAGFVAIVDDERRIRVEAQFGLPEGFVEAVDLDPVHGLFDWSAAYEGGGLFLRDLDAASALGIRSLLAVPLIEGDQPLGIFAVLDLGEAGTLDEGSLDLLDTFAEQIRQMLHNDRLFRDFAAGFLETLQGLSASLDARRAHTRGHHDRVWQIAAAIARELGHDAEQVKALAVAGSIHDAGMAGAGAGAYQADIDHPTVGAGLVEALPLHPWVAQAVAAHHEWWDGWGFPLSLAGEAIPRAGRILAAAEFIDELASGDPVRAPWGPDKLVAELEVRSGSQFEPEIAAAAIRLIRQDALVLGGGP